MADEPESSHIAVERRTEQATTPPEVAQAPTGADFAPESVSSAAILGHPAIGGRGNDPVRAAAIQRLQQTQGNRATRSFLQRQAAAVAVQRDGLDGGTPAPAAAPAAAPPTAAPAATPLSPAQFTVVGGAPSVGGAVQVTPTGSEVMIQAPPVTYQADVSLNPGVTLGTSDPVAVGPVQTLLGSERTGIYRRGGPYGEVVAEYHDTVGQRRDAQWDDSSGEVRASVPAPWYSQPSLISDSSPQAHVNFLDQPSFNVPQQMGEGRLTETRGQDRFTTSVAAKRGEELVHLQSSHWEVPWTTTVDAANQGPGGIVTGSATTDAPPTTDGPIAVAAVENRMRFLTVEAALGADTDTLFANLEPSRANDIPTWLNIVEALRRKNPAFSLTLEVRSTAEWFGSDEVQITLHGHRDAQHGPFSLNDGHSTTIEFQLNDVFDPMALRPDSVITITAQDVGVLSNEAATMSWPFPFDPQRTPAHMTGGGGGKYYITAHRS